MQCDICGGCGFSPCAGFPGTERCDHCGFVRRETHGNWTSLAPYYGGASAAGSYGTGANNPNALAAASANAQLANFFAQQAANQAAGVVSFHGGLHFSSSVFVTSSVLYPVTHSPSAPPPPLPTGNIEVGEVIGYRIWTVNGNRLYSISAGSLWTPGAPMTGTPGDHDYLGVWAFKKYEDALAKMKQCAGTVMGSVWLWGNIVEHDIGYRAQFAEIRSLDGINVFPEIKKEPFRWRDLFKTPAFMTAPNPIIELRRIYGLSEGQGEQA